MRSLLFAATLVPSVAWSAPIEVAVDPRVELVAEVCQLAGVTGYDAGPDTPIRVAARAWFAPYADHPAVLEARHLQETRGIAYGAPVSLAVHLDPRTLAPRWRPGRLPERLDAKWDDATARAFASMLADFAEETRFDAFLAEHADQVAAVEGHYAGFLHERDLVAWFDGVFGPTRKNRYTLVPGLLHGTGNFGVTVDAGRGVHFLPVLGAGRVDDAGLPVVSRSTELLLVHELAHGLVNPVIDAHPDAIEPGARAVLEVAAERMAAVGYGEWRPVAYESLVRAVTVSYATDVLGAGGEALASEEAFGFAWTRDVVDALTACRAADGACPDLALPEVNEALLAFAASPRVPPFRGPINATYEGAWIPARFVMVVPSGSSALAGYVGKVHTALFADRGVPVVDPADVPAEPRAMMLYGSPSTNPRTAALLDRLGWHVGDDGVRLLDVSFEGPHLALVAATANPDAPDLPALLLTAADDADLVGVHGFFAGPTDWVVARRAADGTWTVVAEGDLPIE